MRQFASNIWIPDNTVGYKDIVYTLYELFVDRLWYSIATWDRSSFCTEAPAEHVDNFKVLVPQRILK